MMIRFASIITLLSFLACHQERVVATIKLDAQLTALDGGMIPGDAEPASDAFAVDASPYDAGVINQDAQVVLDAGTDYCEGAGPPIYVGDTNQICSNQLAVKTFRYALCLCQEHTASAPVTVDAFNSETGPYTSAELGGSIGVNGRIQANAGYSTTGSLWVASSGGITSSLPMSVMADLHNQGPMSGQSDLSVGNEARIGGPIELNQLVVGSTLTVPENTNVNVSNQFSYGAYVREPVMIEPPCDCAPDQLVDIAGYVQHHATENDNVQAGIPVDLLDGYSGTTTVSIDCGRIYFSRVVGSGRLHINVSGRAAIFVAGELNLPDDFTVTVEPGGELDFFIEGHLVSARRLQIGSQETPASVRLYLGGTGSFQLSSNSILWANVYAPQAELVTSGPIEVFGSLFLRRLNTSSAINIHYDKGVLQKASACPPTGTAAECATCRDCLNQACINGTCGACRDNRDCCSPLFCDEGVCKPFDL